MTRSRMCGALLVVCVAAGLPMGSPLAAQERAVALRGGTVIPVDGAPIPNGTVVMRGGKIVAVGANVAIPAGSDVVDVRGKYVLPGLVDAMTSLGLGASDLNEPSDPIAPQLRVFEAYNPFGTFGGGKPGPLVNHEILGGGVTTMYIAPADGALIGGQGAVVKTAGATLSALVVREPASMDITLGEPPKSAARQRQRDPATRMAEVAMIRQALIRAQEYDRNKGANSALARDLGMEALGRLLKREFPARIQATSAVDIRSALALAREFGLDLVLDGAASAQQYLDTLAARKIPVVLGQVSHQFVSNEEIPDRSDYPPVDESTAAKLVKGGVKTAIASFSRAFGTLAPSGSSKWLLIDASVAAGYGLSEGDVLRTVTLTPAEILGVADRVGSLTVGKDADVIVLDGPPLSVRSWVTRAYINGELVHQR
ncbi:MAG: amidohydrolase family protein [Gemmatimonadaceae bacterium]|nr:amidohydrolase family protein [Gemmatimonadaceae bacterium]